MNQKNPDIQGYASVLQEAKGTDAETGLLTRTNLYNKLLQELARCERYGNNLSVASVRITTPDKQSMNTNGSDLAGAIGNQLAEIVRNVDYAARWSENEFLVVLPETKEDGARLFVNKVREAIRGVLSEQGDPNVDVLTETTVWETGDDMSGILAKVGVE